MSNAMQMRRRSDNKMIDIEAKFKHLCFGVHRPIYKWSGDTPEYYSKYWTITHLPTGMSISNEAKNINKIRKVLKGIESIPENWDNLDPNIACNAPGLVNLARALNAIGSCYEEQECDKLNDILDNMRG